MFRLVKQALASILFCRPHCACPAVIIVVSGVACDAAVVVEVVWVFGLFSL
jgi:hypothetical protein